MKKMGNVLRLSKKKAETGSSSFNAKQLVECTKYLNAKLDETLVRIVEMKLELLLISRKSST